MPSAYERLLFHEHDPCHCKPDFRGTPYLALRLMEQGYTVVENGDGHLYLFALSVVFETVSAILIAVGLVRLSK